MTEKSYAELNEACVRGVDGYIDYYSDEVVSDFKTD